MCTYCSFVVVKIKQDSMNERLGQGQGHPMLQSPNYCGFPQKPG